jgi:prepilin-type N-terminal cleavage/methylation domain-containing protein
MNDKGFTLIESLVALAILGITLAALVPAFQSFLDANSVSEQRSNALAAGQQAMEALRHVDPASLPTSGSSSPQIVTVGEHEFEVVTTYCLDSSYCGTGTRHITMDVAFAGKDIYTLETVFTRLH